MFQCTMPRKNTVFNLTLLSFKKWWKLLLSVAFSQLKNLLACFCGGGSPRLIISWGYTPHIPSPHPFSLPSASQISCIVSTIPFPLLPLPFRRSVLPFRSYRCRCGWERKCWKRLCVYTGMKWPERWLVVHLRQNGKNRIRSYCYGTAVTAQRQVGTATVQRIFFT